MMDKLGMMAAGLFGTVGILALALIIYPLIGYVAGWLFGFVFSETWYAFHSWLKMPENMTPSMFGAFGMFAGGFVRVVVKEIKTK